AEKKSAGANKSPYGVTFHRAWAEWPVGQQGENQLYHFANYNFTLMATVSIDNVAEGGSVPVMGATLNGDGNTVLLELSYNNEKKWQFSCGGQTTEKFSSTLGVEKTPHVVILVRSGNQSSAYVDGQRVGGPAPCTLGNTESKNISHFFIGGDGGSTVSREGVSVTVTNVLLYNRPLDGNEIGTLNSNKDTIQRLEKELAKNSSVSSGSVVPPTSPVNTTSQQNGTPSTPAVTNPTEQGQSMGSSNDASGGVEEGIDLQDRDVNAMALSSSLGNVSQGNDGDAGTMRGSGLLPSLLLLLGLWGFAAL
ncbi:trans-sialidase, putative, partial [Trypanosoma cruzi marinkellei]